MTGMAIDNDNEIPRDVLAIGFGPETSRYPCRACGHRTIVAPPPGPPGTWQVCPICFWEDTPEQEPEIELHWTGHGDRSNSVSLRQAQRNITAFGAAEPSYAGSVRAPLPEEAPDPAWRSEDVLARTERQALILAIVRAFAGVSREGGVSLHETVVLDRYGTTQERQAARQLDGDRRWQEVAYADLAEVCGIGGIAFFDPIGWRYHLPAYLTWYLAAGEDGGSLAAQFVIFSLELAPPPLDTAYRERYRMLDDAQAATVTRFLEYVVRFGSECRSHAANALESYWGARGAVPPSP